MDRRHLSKCKKPDSQPGAGQAEMQAPFSAQCSEARNSQRQCRGLLEPEGENWRRMHSKSRKADELLWQ